MDKTQLLDKVLGLFTGFKSKAAATIGKDLGAAFNNEAMLLYDRFRHWFVKEDPTAAAVWKKYEDQPSATQPVVQSIAEEKLSADPAFAETLQQALADLENRHFDTINRIGEVSGKGNTIRQGSGNTGTGGKTQNEVGKVQGDNNFIEQGSYNYDPRDDD